LLSVLLFACNGGETEETPTPTPSTETPIIGVGQIRGAANIELTVGAVFDPRAGVTAVDGDGNDITSSLTVTGVVNLNTVGNYTLTYQAVDSQGTITTLTRLVSIKGLEGCSVHQKLENGICVNIPPTTIVIMHGAPYEVDPFHKDYSATEQLARQIKQREVEALNNVKVEYRAYPAEAAWGPSRVTAIINASTSGSHLADIYWTTTDWTQQLANAEAIVPIDKYLSGYGSNIHADWLNVGAYKQQSYGFGPGNITVDTGLYYNANLIENLGVENPSQLFLDGLWTWSKFDQWATQVKTALASQGEGYYALGGMLSMYAENMIPLNGGSLINQQTGRVSFAQTPALETYTFLNSLYVKGLFEINPQYDAGSPDWMAGKVAMHPGNLWFVNAPNRWGSIAFELGYVPFPKNNTFAGDYISPVSGLAVYNLASGMTAAREELVFKVWNELQLWKTEEQLESDFRLSLITKFDDVLYVDAYLAIYDKVYLELINAIGINPYTENGWRRNINVAIREGTARTVVDQIRPIYQAELDKYLN
jgi:fructooligosaccharide transport system substrate-binding protein